MDPKFNISSIKFCDSCKLGKNHQLSFSIPPILTSKSLKLIDLAIFFLHFYLLIVTLEENIWLLFIF